jgi:hypothetical protein
VALDEPEHGCGDGVPGLRGAAWPGQAGIVSLAALILAIAGTLVALWSMNGQRNQWLWLRDGAHGPRPRPWQLRYRRRT